MKGIIVDIDKLTDSKELYNQKPKKIMFGFIYLIVFMFICALVYSFFGKIEIKAQGVGIVRPNEKVSTVSGVVGGQIEEVKFMDGSPVNEGDVLLVLNYTDLQTDLKNLEANKATTQSELEMTEKYIASIQQGRNLFSSSDSVEYPWHVKYELYDVSVRDKQLSIDYEQQQEVTKKLWLEKAITRQNEDIQGLTLLKQSIESNSNKAAKYPRYSYQYQLYSATLESIETTRANDRGTVELDATTDSRQVTIDFYNKQIEGYKTLLDCVEKGENLFTDKNSMYSLMYEEHAYLMEDARKAHESAKLQLELLRENKAAGTQAPVDTSIDDAEPPVADANTADALQNEADIDSTAGGAALNFAASLNDGGEDAPLAESMSPRAADYEITVAEMEVAKAEKAIEAQKSKTLQEAKAALADAEQKKAELDTAQGSTLDKQTALQQIDETYEQSIEQKKLALMQQAEESAQLLRQEQLSNQAELEQLGISLQKYEDIKTGSDEIIPVAYIRLQELQTNLDNKKAAEQKLLELDYSIQKTKLDIEAATIRASRSGVVNTLTDVSQGDVLQAGTMVATIIPPEEQQYKVQIYVDDSNMVGIKVGDTVKYTINGLPRTQYGTMEGKVTSISKDTKSMGDAQQALYLVEATLDGKELKDKDGNEGELSVGMTLDAKIVTQKKRILFYLLEKINVL